MPHVVQGAEELKSIEGKTFGPSEWFAVEQDRIQLFADATGDQQWIHTDPVRAAKESPFKKPIAHGYLTLSVLPVFFSDLLQIEGAKLAVNYGLDKVRFPAPVPAGSRVRATIAVSAIEEITGGSQMRATATVEVEGGTKPVCVAEILYRYYF